MRQVRGTGPGTGSTRPAAPWPRCPGSCRRWPRCDRPPVRRSGRSRRPHGCPSTTRTVRTGRRRRSRGCRGSALWCSAGGSGPGAGSRRTPAAAAGSWPEVSQARVGSTGVRVDSCLAHAGRQAYFLVMPDEAWGVVDLALITAGVVTALWLIAHAADILELGVRCAEALGLVKAPAARAPATMPIERIAADLRRIRPQARMPAMGTPMVRRRAVAAAYDEGLLDARRALDVPTQLGRMTDALERESERLRTEHELQRAGVDLG